jgi:hypothetical protein
MRIRFTTLCAALCIIFNTNGTLNSQSLTWQNTSAERYSGESPWLTPEAAYSFGLNFDNWKSTLAASPSEDSQEKGLIISLPSPTGEPVAFEIFAYDLLPTELQKKFPEIRTWWGKGIDNPMALLRLDHGTKGFHAQILEPSGSWYIDPAFKNNTEVHYSYFRKDLPNIHAAFFTCQTEGEEILPLEDEVFSQSPLGPIRRTYRTAVAATGEYTQFHGGTVQAGMSAITTAMNRVTGIYEREFAVRMTLIPNNDLIVYTNASTDPYSNNNGSAMLTQNRDNLNSVIGSANYDVGHVFSTGGGGIAQLASVCGSSKAMGVTGLPNPNGDPFWVDYVCHEFGHQFNANHTFNSSTGGCQGNRSSNNAYEPGSGSTIIAYAGLCAPNNVQNLSSDYFHIRSYVTVRNFITGSGGACAANQNTGNSAPVVTAPEGGKVMPISTPFKLTASGSDPDGDPITYCWEQYDLGAALNLSTAPTSGTPPLHRSFPPTQEPTRYFPRLPLVVLGNDVNTERYATYTRNLNFRVSVRDNKPNGGGRSFDQIALQTTSNAGPFTVTSQNAPGEMWTVGMGAIVTWDVANTNQTPVNCATVNIWLSTNNGQSFDYPLATGVPNNGSATFWVPNLPGEPSLLLNNCRVMVEAADNYFYNVNQTGFTVNNILSNEAIQTEGPALSAFPNPTQDGIVFLNHVDGRKITRVLDISGRSINVPASLENDNWRLDFSAHAAGWYLIVVSDGEHTRVTRVNILAQ